MDWEALPVFFLARHFGEEGELDDVFVVENCFGDQAVLPEEVAVVGGEDHDGLVRDAHLIEGVEEATDLAIHEGDHAVVAGHVRTELSFVVAMGVAAVDAEAVLVAVGKADLAGLFPRLTMPGGHFVEFALDVFADRHIRRIVHARKGPGHGVGRMGISKARPGKKRLLVRDGLLHHCDRSLRSPDRIVQRFGERPGAIGRAGLVMGVIGAIGAFAPADTVGRVEIFLPVGQSLIFEPGSIMLSGVRFISVIAMQLDMLKAIPRSGEMTPEVDITQRRLTLDRCLLRVGRERLKVRFTDQMRGVTGFAQMFANGGDRLVELCPE